MNRALLNFSHPMLLVFLVLDCSSLLEGRFDGLETEKTYPHQNKTFFSLQNENNWKISERKHSLLFGHTYLCTKVCSISREF